MATSSPDSSALEFYISGFVLSQLGNEKIQFLTDCKKVNFQYFDEMSMSLPSAASTFVDGRLMTVRANQDENFKNYFCNSLSIL